MKKFLSLILALAMAACMGVTAFAADGTTVLTAEVPDNTFTYTLHVPATATIPYGATNTEIGELSATVDPTFLNSSGNIIINNVEKFLKVSLSHGDLSNGTDSIPYILGAGNFFSFRTTSGDSVSVFPLTVRIDEAAWNVSPGTYTSTITYTVEVKDN